MEKRAVLAIVLSLVVVVLWSLFFAPAPPPPPSEVFEPAPRSSEPRPGAGTPPAAPISPGSVTSAARTTELPPGSPAAPEALVTVDTGVARLTLTSQGASVREVQLNAYHTTMKKGHLLSKSRQSLGRLRSL
jgi:YidC/Oxa1 family membrane protein insertase